MLLSMLIYNADTKLQFKKDKYHNNAMTVVFNRITWINNTVSMTHRRKYKQIRPINPCTRDIHPRKTSKGSS